MFPLISDLAPWLLFRLLRDSTLAALVIITHSTTHIKFSSRTASRLLKPGTFRSYLSNKQSCLLDLLPSLLDEVAPSSWFHHCLLTHSPRACFPLYSVLLTHTTHCSGHICHFCQKRWLSGGSGLLSLQNPAAPHWKECGHYYTASGCS